MSVAKQIANRMLNELPEDMVSHVISFISFMQYENKNNVFKDIEEASMSSLGFWDNNIDDEVWNNV